MIDQSNRLKALQKPAWFRWLLSCLFNWLIVATCFYGVYCFQNIWAVMISILIIGNRQHALALLGHEGAHYMLSTNHRWNDFLTGFFSFWPLGINLPGYRNFHFTHHQNVGTINDPELKHKKMNAPEFELPLSKSKLILYFFKDILFFSAYEVIQLITFVVPQKKYHLLIPNLFLAAIIVPLLYFGFTWVIILWFLANMSSFWAFFRIRVYIEHIGTSKTHRLQSNPFLNLIFFPYGADMHWEHHEWPTMLWYNRVKARKLVTEPSLISVKELFESYKGETVYTSSQPRFFVNSN